VLSLADGVQARAWHQRERRVTPTIPGRQARWPERIGIAGWSEEYHSFKAVDNEGKYSSTSSPIRYGVRAARFSIGFDRSAKDKEGDRVDRLYEIFSDRGWVHRGQGWVIVRLEPLQQPAGGVLRARGDTC